MIEKEEETIDRTDEDLRKTERQIRLLSSEIKQIEDYLNRPEIKERAERLEKVVSTLKIKIICETPTGRRLPDLRRLLGEERRNCRAENASRRQHRERTQ